eukprot:TRINITY_DN1195_c1_g4_i1.p1 TRINITY_DN1195_c1_g4~~TRINITY_DN1195_c1_g4_i1.p1  ORF type:complete len:120 (+),score=9.57 TRINITY_DN1195_c1_g4_i1:61-420(+)
MANPIDNHWNQSRPSQIYSPSSGPGSPTFDAAKEKAGQAADACCNTCCSDDVKDHLATLIQYAATIIIALALWGLIYDGIMPSDKPIWLLWIFATVMLIISIAVSWWTGETLHFGEDCC